MSRKEIFLYNDINKLNIYYANSMCTEYRLFISIPNLENEIKLILTHDYLSLLQWYINHMAINEKLNNEQSWQDWMCKNMKSLNMHKPEFEPTPKWLACLRSE